MPQSPGSAVGQKLVPPSSGAIARLQEDSKLRASGHNMTIADNGFRQAAPNHTFDMPSSTTLKWLAATAVFTSLICFSQLSADHNCGAQSWDCATFAGIALVSIIAGLGLGLLLTAMVVLAGWCYLLVHPSAAAPETKSRSLPMALALVAMHLLVFGVMAGIGVLPLGWIWWLGAFGAVGMHPSGTVYLIPPG